MTKKAQEILKKAYEKKYVVGTPFDRLIIVRTGKMYRGVWGKNGYENMILIAMRYMPGSDVKEYMLIQNDDGDQQIDAVDFLNYDVGIDTPVDEGCMNVFFRSYKMVINGPIASHVFIERA